MFMTQATMAAVLAAAVGALPCAAVGQTPDDATIATQRCPRQTELANVFSFGCAGDRMPKDDAKFAELLVKIKAGGFNTVHAVYTPARLELCAKHGLRRMVDVLAVEAGHDVYKTPQSARARRHGPAGCSIHGR